MHFQTLRNIVQDSKSFPYKRLQIFFMNYSTRLHIVLYTGDFFSRLSIFTRKSRRLQHLDYIFYLFCLLVSYTFLGTSRYIFSNLTRGRRLAEHISSYHRSMYATHKRKERKNRRRHNAYLILSYHCILNYNCSTIANKNSGAEQVPGSNLGEIIIITVLYHSTQNLTFRRRVGAKY